MRGTYLLGLRNTKIDSGCAVLPKLIKHEAHHHLLTPNSSHHFMECLAWNKLIDWEEVAYECNEKSCYFYIHVKCGLKPLTLTHQWDPHPLHLIFSPEEVTYHPHEFHVL